MKFQAKPVTVTAHQIRTVTLPENEAGAYVLTFDDREPLTVTQRQCGAHVPLVDDFFIFREDGDNYLCPAPVFREKYEPVRADSAR